MFKKSVLLLVYSFLVGHLLLIFTWHGYSLSRYIYSLGALFVGFHFFRMYESKKMRIGLVIMSVVFWAVLTFVYVVIGKIPILNLEPPGMVSQ